MSINRVSTTNRAVVEAKVCVAEASAETQQQSNVTAALSALIVTAACLISFAVS